MAVKGKELEGNGVALGVVLHVPTQHYPHLEVLLVRRNRKQDLRVIEQRELVVEEFGLRFWF